MEKKRQLPRLPREWYRGTCFVFWTFTTERRTTGWLDDSYHLLFREILLHTLIRYRLLCPAYCLMPDHLHWVGIGISKESDQLLATSFARKFLTIRSGGNPQWQRQPHDHVLREEERKRHAFAKTCHYIWMNPVRANLVTDEELWPYRGAIVPGFPMLSPSDEGFWDRFWKIHEELTGHG